eukprot:CAMPEP_0171530258 /NCGR_PEP_ID=MMETSP0959-20130129/12931_1 /TAXON_ID=87120 /ORGANISM="Aurantiochytrium limacinum, Strain ATCCMYA-1381" /LENGTH=32 /DNA_ID= /DNA_START= /DNA_END= /DNA_ORIENTATION=
MRECMSSVESCLQRCKYEETVGASQRLTQALT